MKSNFIGEQKMNQIPKFYSFHKNESDILILYSNQNVFN